MDQNNDYQYWVVQLGQLYYAGGLGRTSQIVDSFSYEFVSHESLAFPFILDVAATHIAESCGGTILSRHATLKEYSVLSDKNSNYIKSEKEFHAEQLHEIIKTLTTTK
ncbi:hypothetical protein Q0V21_31140 [Paenibacillus sp. 11B]|uniref:hypothetical protein n=1 Tax=Paenibacillus sp. 11B TaxID=3060965 RepID=UPI002656C5A0|nr:hypothetical protein [Paenibacillus sp. 11B]MDN8593187.1 hypothetical protein [Paenibacillus sp. 11B]